MQCSSWLQTILDHQEAWRTYSKGLNPEGLTPELSPQSFQPLLLLILISIPPKSVLSGALELIRRHVAFAGYIDTVSGEVPVRQQGLNLAASPFHAVHDQHACDDIFDAAAKQLLEAMHVSSQSSGMQELISSGVKAVGASSLPANLESSLGMTSTDCGKRIAASAHLPQTSLRTTAC